MAIRDAIAKLLGQDSKIESLEWMGAGFREMVLGLTAEELYRTQPHLRIVLSFVARNVAHLGLPAFERTSDTDRRRLVDDPLALLLSHPNPAQTRYELIESLVLDLGLYDRAYWMVSEVSGTPSGWTIQPIPPSWVVKQAGGTAFTVARFEIQLPNGQRTEVPAENMLVFHGWNPGRPKHGTSPIETLKQILAEQVQAWSYRQQVWQRGGRVGAVITRPAGNTWSDAARNRFLTEWREAWTGQRGAKAGGTPVLEDGMTINRLGFSAREDEWAEVSKIALSTVAAVYHVNPVMVGILDNANFSNTKEFRKMLYSETLGPLLAMIEDRLNTFLVPKITKAPGAYVEFNIAEKLQGDFEEQAAILSTSTGAPWMTRNEARARQNLPALAGGDELVIPLNVLTGGQASPRDSAPKGIDPTFGPAHVIEETTRKLDLKDAPQRRMKSDEVVTDEYEETARLVLSRFFKRQRASVLSQLGAKAPSWWNGSRWDSELAADLFKLSVATATAIGREQAAALGFSEEDYDEDRTLAFLKSVAQSRAGAINSTTRERIEAALDAGEDPAEVFDEAESARTESGSTALVAAVAGFAVAEVGKQLAGAKATKTWIAGPNPRVSHAVMDGETVGIDDLFSNGMKWPGDVAGGADEVAGCNCSVSINF